MNYMLLAGLLSFCVVCLLHARRCQKQTRVALDSTLELTHIFNDINPHLSDQGRALAHPRLLKVRDDLAALIK
jgi:hypothetical protein